MKTKYTHYNGVNAKSAWDDSKSLLRRYKGWSGKGISDKELLKLLKRVGRLEVCADAFGGGVDLTWHGCGGKVDMTLDCDDDHWIKLFMNVLPRLQELLTERESVQNQDDKQDT